MSIATQLNRIKTAKAGMKASLENKGVTVGSSATIDSYSTLVDSIPAGVNEDFSDLIDRSITSIDIPSGVTGIKSHAFSGCINLTSVTIPDTVTDIGMTGGWTFQNTALSSITIPSSVTNIREKSFRNCTTLSSITCLATTAPALGANVFSGVSSTGALYVPSGSDYSAWTAALPSAWNLVYIDTTLEVVPLTFKNIGSTVADVSLSNYSGNTPNVEYSTDGQTWQTWDYSTIEIPVGDSVYFRGENPTGFSKGSSNSSGGTITSFSKFVSTQGELKVSGHLESLNYHKYVSVGGGKYHRCFVSLFSSNTHIVDAYGLNLSVRLLRGEGYYHSLFNACTNLIRAPRELPATSITEGCYFNFCVDCSNLEDIPEVLPSLSLKYSCYEGMFARCPKLTKTPLLPATELTDRCYRNMFLNGSAITECTCFDSTTPASGYTSGWLSNVSSNGILFRSLSPSWTTTGSYGIPSAWIIRKYSQYHTYTTSNAAAITPNTTSGWGAGYSSSQKVKDNQCIINLAATASTLYIPANAFSGKTTLTGFETGKVNSIGSKAFYGCTNLKSVRVLGDGNSSVSIDNQAFANCNHSINSILIMGNAPTLGTDVFTGSCAAQGRLYVRTGKNYSAIYNEIITKGCQGVTDPVDWKICYF